MFTCQPTRMINNSFNMKHFDLLPKSADQTSLRPLVITKSNICMKWLEFYCFLQTNQCVKLDKDSDQIGSKRKQ